MACREWQWYMNADSERARDDGFRNLMRVLPLLGLTPADRAKIPSGELKSSLKVPGGEGMQFLPDRLVLQGLELADVDFRC